MAGSFTVDIHELTTLANKFAGSAPIVTRHLDKGGRQAGFLVQRQAQGDAPVKTGNYKNAIGPPKVNMGAHGGTVEVTAHADYSAVIEEGHGVIVPKSPNGVLAFEWKGEMVFTKRVGPVAGKHIMANALKKQEANIDKAFGDAIAAAVAEITG